MQFIHGKNRHQTYFTTADEQITADNLEGLIDASKNKIQLQQLGFTNTVPKSDAPRHSHPALLLKLYLYGYINKIHSSCKFEKECYRNMNCNG